MPKVARDSRRSIRYLLLASFIFYTVRSKAQEEPQISSVSPVIAYPYEEIHIYGSNFGKDPNLLALMVNGRTIPLESNPDCSTQRATPASPTPTNTQASPTMQSVCATFHLDVTPNEIDLSNLTKEQLESLTGEVRLQTRQSNGVAISARNVFIKSSQMTWSDVTEASILVALGLSIIPLLLVGFGTRQMIDTGVKSGLFSTFLLDPQTNSLSLSKFQFYVWTATAIFGYIYLLIANLFVQQTGQFPDVPSSLPWIFGTSIGTSIGIGAITSVRGPKGAGEIRPKLSDLITAGGVVQPDRLQYLVWTLVGASGYVLTILHLDPRGLSKLPTIPTTLLTLGGVSAAGYVGGRLATKVGPVVDTADISIAGAPAPDTTVSGGTATGAIGAAASPQAPGRVHPVATMHPSVAGIQQALTASSQTLQSLNAVDSKVTSAVQTIQSAITKSTLLIQTLSSANPGPPATAGLPQMAQEALTMGRSAAAEITRFAEANLGSMNPASPDTVKNVAQTADQVLQQLNLLSDMVAQTTTAAPGTPAVSVPAPTAVSTTTSSLTADPNTMWVLMLRGRGLSKDATFTFFDPNTPTMEVDLPIPPLMAVNNAAQISPDQLNAGNANPNPEIVEPDADADATTMAKVLRVRFRSPAFVAKRQQLGRLNLKITNPDGQTAVFPLDKSQA